MWPTVFMALCILGLDLLIYLFFHRIYGDKRSAVARQVAAFRGQSPTHCGSFHKRPFLGTNPVDKLITSGLPVIRSQSSEDDALRQVLKCKESGSGTIIREWHPWGKVPGRLGSRKMLTRFLPKAQVTSQ
jgi:hypothetical protein